MGRALWITDLASWRYSDEKTPLDPTHEAATCRSMSRPMLAETLVETAGLYRAPNRSICSHRKTTITIHLASGGTGALAPLVAGPDNRRNRMKTLLLAASAAFTLAVGSAYAMVTVVATTISGNGPCLSSGMTPKWRQQPIGPTRHSTGLPDH